jgi:hypothetical protein
MPQFSDDLFLGTAQTYMGTGPTAVEGVFYGSITGTTLTITQQLSGDPLVVGQYIGSSTITAGTYITAFGTGTGGVGTYTVSASQSVSAANVFASGNALLGDPAPMDLGIGPMGRVYVWDCIPQAKVANNIATSQTPAAAGSLTLTAGTAVKSITTAAGVSALQLDCARAVSVTTATAAATTLASVAITGTAGQISFTSQSGLVSGQYLVISGTLGGTGSITGYSNPTTYILTAVTATTATLTTTAGAAIVTTAGTPTGLTYTLGAAPQTVTVSGYDYYGQAMTEAITSSGVVSTAVNGKKAFSLITSITVGGATGVALTVGTTDIIGLPIRVVDAGYIASVGWANTLARDAGTFVAAVTTTATSTTGDVRGTYAPSSATNGYSRIVMTIACNGIMVGPNATRQGALGVTQA